MPRLPISPPDWWSQNLYSFINNELPLSAWVWEFMRRKALQQILCNMPVDAMNPNPDLEHLHVDYWNYYKSWDCYQQRKEQPAFFPPAVSPLSGWPKGFHGQQFRINDSVFNRQEPFESHLVNIRVNLNRRDSIIKRDFHNFLEAMRPEHPEPSRLNTRASEWRGMHILEVWDLRQFRVSWGNIALSLHGNHSDRSILQSVRNAYTAAHRYIDDGKWFELACHIDAE